MAASRKRPSKATGYVMTQSHKDNISKGLKEYHRGRGGKKSITKSVGKRLRTGTNDNAPGLKKTVTTKPRNKHTEHVVKNFHSKRLAHRELKDYKRIRRKTQAGKASMGDLHAYKKRARRRFALDKAIGRVKSFFKRKR